MGVLSFLLWLAPGGWRIDGSDSLAVLRSARRAQEAYETTRRYNLPEQFGNWGDACGERFGQICAWSQGSVADETPPEEPWRIRQARARLLAALDQAIATSPGDEWIVGQRVRYLLEDGQPGKAARAANLPGHPFRAFDHGPYAFASVPVWRRSARSGRSR